MIVHFDTQEQPSLSLVGGKGLSLIKLTQAGLPVPAGFVCTTRFFAPWLEQVAGSEVWQAVETAVRRSQPLTTATEALKQQCHTFTFTPAQNEQLNRALQPFPPDTRFAVRSSSPEEDLEGASFAGGYTTTLGVSRPQILDAVRAAFASAFDERIFIYKQQQGFAHTLPTIAVIIQQQIAADCAGVGFSLNPLNNDYDEAVIDANWGLGESVVSGLVTPDHVVVDKVSLHIVEKRMGSKETAVYLQGNGRVTQSPPPHPQTFSLTDSQIQELTQTLIKIETLYQQPVDIEWAYAQNSLHLLQARPITTYIPLHPTMQTKPGDPRILFYDAGLSEGVTTNKPMTPLTLDWMFGSFGMWAEPFFGPVTLRANANPFESLAFGAGGRFYANFSQLLTLVSVKRIAKEAAASDALLAELLANIDEKTYRAKEKMPAFRWHNLLKRIPLALWSFRHFLWNTLFSFLFPEKFYSRYAKEIEQTIQYLKQIDPAQYTLRELIEKLDRDLTPVIAKTAFPPIIPYFYYMGRLEKLFGQVADASLLESLRLGFAGNEAVDISIQQYKMAKMLPPEAFADLDGLAQQIVDRTLPPEFMAAWDRFVAHYGMRGPGELELANARYGDDPRVALEQMAYMVDSDFDPEAMQQQHIAARQAAYERLLAQVNGRKRRQLKHAYKILDLFGPTRDTPKYLWVLDNGLARQRALQEGHKFVSQGRLDKPEDIFWLTLDDIDQANHDPTFDLRQARDAQKPFYRKLANVKAFPHLIDSRGRILRAPSPANQQGVLTGLGISRGTARGRVKVLHSPREKPVEKGDVLVAYTTDPGWTPLFVNASAILLEVGGMLQHGGVVAREYGKPCVAGIQGITVTLQDGQLVEVDGTNGIVRLLDEE